MTDSQVIVFLLIFLIINIVDIYLYSLAKYPERTKFIYKLPFGGLVALIQFGFDGGNKWINEK